MQGLVHIARVVNGVFNEFSELREPTALFCTLARDS